MENKTIKCVFVNAKKGEITLENVKDDLDTFYSMLECNTIDIVERKFNGVTCDIIIDDNGLFVDPDRQYPAIATYSKGQLVEVIVGNVLITGCDYATGETVSLTEQQIEAILNSLGKLYRKGTSKEYAVVNATV